MIAFGFLLLLVLHFSSVVSKLSDETRVLAQRLALLEQQLARSSRPARGRRGSRTSARDRDAGRTRAGSTVD